MGIHSVGGAGQQGDVILPFLDGKPVHRLWLYDLDFVHLIGQHLVQNGDRKHIPHHQLVQVAEQLG